MCYYIHIIREPTTGNWGGFCFGEKEMGVNEEQLWDAFNKALSHYFNIIEHRDDPEQLQIAIDELLHSSTIRRLTQCWVALNHEDIDE